MNNSLQDSLTAEDFIGQIRLSLNSINGKDKVYVLVEGVNDFKIYTKFFYKNKASIEYTNGKEILLIALTELKKITNQIIGVRDADFNHLQGIQPPFKGLFFTDYHDIEMTMLNDEDVLYNILTEYGLQNDAKPILQKALDETEFIGYVRWCNEIGNIKLNFDGMGLGGFVKPHDMNASLDINNYLNALNGRSKNKTRTVVSADVATFKQQHNTSDFFNLCNGHDVTTVIALLLGGKVSHDQFCAVLRASFSINYFHKTKLYVNIFQWQTDNGFCILK